MLELSSISTNCLLWVRRLRRLLANPVCHKLSGILLTDERLVNLVFSSLPCQDETKVALANALSELAQKRQGSIIDLLSKGDDSLLSLMEELLESINFHQLQGASNEETSKTN